MKCETLIQTCFFYFPCMSYYATKNRGQKGLQHMFYKGCQAMNNAVFRKFIKMLKYIEYQLNCKITDSYIL